MIDLPELDWIHLSPKAFKKMKRLRLFISRNASFSEEPNFHSHNLRVIDWAEYQGESFPSNFCGKNLRVLRMAHSCLKGLEGVQVKFFYFNICVFKFCCKLLLKFKLIYFLFFLDSISKT